MSSIFTFLHEPDQPTEPGASAGAGAPAQPGTPVEATATSAGPSSAVHPPAAAVAGPLPAIPAVAPVLDLNQVLQDMLDKLAAFLPAPVNGVPDPTVMIISLNDAPVGLGNFIGEEPRGPLGRVGIKAGRLDAVVRFMLWNNSFPAVNTAMLSLQADLLAAARSLWEQGFLQFKSLTSSNPELDNNLSAWNRSADYGLLYEYSYEASDDAQSLISRIPINADPEVLNAPSRETTTVTDEMARWDELAAPALVLRGASLSSNLALLVFIPGTAPSGTVTLTRTFDDATGAPVSHPDLASFLAALADTTAPERHASVQFANFSAFLAQFSAAGTTLRLGDWNLDSNPDEYQGYELALDPAVHLPGVFDRLEVTYGDGINPLDQTAVIYLRMH